jgi:hypothetical protein
MCAVENTAIISEELRSVEFLHYFVFLGNFLANTFTVKPVISNKFLLASILAFHDAFGDDPNAAIPSNVFAEKLGVSIFEKMELLKSAEYQNRAIDAVKSSSVLTDAAKMFRKSIPLAPLMENVSESISKQYITFTDVGIVNGDYAFMLSAEFCLAQFVAASKVQVDASINLQQECESLFLQFKKNSEVAQEHLDYINNSGLEGEYKKFSLSLMDSFLKEGVKAYKKEDFIKALIDGGYGDFVVVSGVV